MDVEFLSNAPGFDELELRIFQDGRSRYRADLLLPDGGRASNRLSAVPQEILAGSADPFIYGRHLYDWLFQDELGYAFQSASKLASSPYRSLVSDVRLRIRLWLDPESKELHRINWETLWGPDEKLPLSMRTAFSRFLRVSIPQTRLITDRPLRMLVFAASPQDMPLLDISNTLDFLYKTVKSGYLPFSGRLELTVIKEPSTIQNLINSIGEDVRILHLFAQSSLQNKKRCMILAGENGRADGIPYETIAEMMVTAKNKLPDLVFISAPLRPDQHKVDLEDFLGPTLISNGTQAVVSIEAAMDSSALNVFTKEFYRLLSRTGVVDEAVARARTTIIDSGWNWSAPVLYTRAQENIQIFQQISGSVEGHITGINISKF